MDPISKRASAVDWREVALVAAGSIAFGLLFSYSILPHLDEPGVFWDWDLIRVLAWVPWKSVASFHQVPAWNPYLCGGIPMIGDPEASIVTPFFLLRLALGPVIGIHLEIPLHLAIAWAGGYLLARVLGLGTLAAITCATIFPSSSWFYLHVVVGHYSFMPPAYWPWMFACALLAIDRHRLGWASLAGFFMAIIFLEGAPYQATYAGLLLGSLLVLIGIARRDPWPFFVLAVAGSFAIGFAAVKMIPTYAFMAQHPRPTFTRELVPLRDVMTALFSRDQDCHREGIADYAFFEAGAYLSPFFVALILVGVIARLRRAWPWLLVGAIMIGLALGNFSPDHAPWTLLHLLPIFSSERVAIRLLVPFVLCLGVIAAYGVDFLERYRP